MQERMRGDSMAKSRVRASGSSRFAGAVVMLGVMIGAAFLMSGAVSPDRLLERSYARVAPMGTIHLDEPVVDTERALNITRTAIPAPPALLIDGVPVESGVLSEPLAVGARLRLAPGTADAREVEVLEVAEMNAPVVGLPGVRLQLVKARALDTAGPTDTVRLIFTVREPDRPKVVPIAAPTSGKVL